MMTLKDFYNAISKSYSFNTIHEYIYVRANGRAECEKILFDNLMEDLRLKPANFWEVTNISVDTTHDEDDNIVTVFTLDLKVVEQQPISHIENITEESEKEEKHFNNVVAQLGGNNIQYLRLTDEQLRLFDYLVNNKVDISRDEKEREFKEI